ncbi:MAG: transposase [Desulfobacterales bacterium]|nr:transposase [Desulfobacterales bacterium]
MSSRRIRPKHTEEFKRDAVRMVIENRYRSNEVGRRLGVNGSNVSRWVREYRDEQEAAAGGIPNRRELDTENRQLRKENKRLQMERKILKKRRPSLRRNRTEVGFYPAANEGLSGHFDV